jgi:glucose-6-phosphate-specific signal transduction histidine kinase
MQTINRGAVQISPQRSIYFHLLLQTAYIHLVPITIQPYIKPHINSVVYYIILMLLKIIIHKIKDKKI